MKIAAAVILYNPNDDLINNILSYISFVQTIYVLDNSEIPEKELIDKITAFNNVFYLFDGENKGIAKRLNQACDLAISKGFELLLTMDQDSYFDALDMVNYFNCIRCYINKGRVSMYGVEYVKNQPEKVCMPVQVQQLITSGSILNLRAFSTIGGFDENLFIDEVDLDYCYNSITKGFEIIKFNNVFLNHNLGKTSYHRSFKNLKSTPRTLHPPIRVYYMIRNFLYIDFKYKNGFNQDRKRRKKALLNRLKNNLLYGSNKLLLIKLAIEAFSDFKNKRMGKKQIR